MPPELRSPRNWNGWGLILICALAVALGIGAAVVAQPFVRTSSATPTPTAPQTSPTASGEIHVRATTEPFTVLEPPTGAWLREGYSTGTRHHQITPGWSLPVGTSQDGETLAYHTGERLVGIDVETAAQAWEVSARACSLGTWQGRALCHLDGKLTLVDLATGKPGRAYEGSVGTPSMIEFMGSADGRAFFLHDGDQNAGIEILAVDEASVAWRAALDIDDAPRQYAIVGTDELAVATTDYNVYVFSRSTGAEVHRREDFTLWLIGQDGYSTEDETGVHWFDWSGTAVNVDAGGQNENRIDAFPYYSYGPTPVFKLSEEYHAGPAGMALVGPEGTPLVWFSEDGKLQGADAPEEEFDPLLSVTASGNVFATDGLDEVRLFARAGSEIGSVTLPEAGLPVVIDGVIWIQSADPSDDTSGTSVLLPGG